MTSAYQNRALGCYFWMHQSPWAQRSFLGVCRLRSRCIFFFPPVNLPGHSDLQKWALGSGLGESCILAAYIWGVCSFKLQTPSSRLMWLSSSGGSGRMVHVVLVFSRFVSLLWFLFILFLSWSKKKTGGKSEPVPSENELKPASSILCTWLGVLMGLPPRAGHYLVTSPSSRQKEGRVQASCRKQAPYIHPCSRNKWSAIGLFRVGLEFIVCLQKWEISEVAQHKRMQMITGQQ